MNKFVEYKKKYNDFLQKNKFLNFLSRFPELYLVPIFILVFIILLAVATRGFNPDLAPYDSNMIKVSNFEIKWYAVFIVTGIIFAVIISIKEVEKLKISKNDVFDGVLIIVPLSIIGSRLYYVATAKDANINSFLDVINITQGGLAIHGAIITAAIFAIILCKIKKINILKIMDLVAIGFLIGQILGRWGNFMNQEAHGPEIGATSEFLGRFPFAPFITEQMKISGKYYHPTFLYEGTLNFIMLMTILVVRRFRLLKIGDSFFMYIIWYGLVRGLVIEPIRTDPLFIFGLRVNILFSLTLFAGGGVMLLILKYFLMPDLPFYYDISQGTRFDYVDPKKNRTKLMFGPKKINKKYKAVIFDLDGTVIDSSKSIFRCAEKSMKEILNIELTEEQKYAFLGPTLKESFSKYTNDQEKIDLLIDTYRKYNKEDHKNNMIKPFNNAKNIFKWIKKNNLKLIIATSKKNSVAKEGLAINNLLFFVDFIVGSDDVKKHKPDPEVLQKALDIYNLKPSEAIYIGDNETDIFAAKAINMVSVGVGYSLQWDKLEKSNPDYIITDLIEIEQILMEEI